MADPLSLLRQFHISEKSVTERDNKIIFNDLAFPSDAKTNYVKYGTGKENIPKDYYTLSCLVFFLKNISLRHPSYVKRAAEDDVGIVNLADRKDLLAYLSGETSTSESIDKTAPITLPDAAARFISKPTYKRPASPIQSAGNDGSIAPKRLPAMLDSAFALQSATNTEHIRPLSDQLTAEKIAAIKSKIYQKKRTTIQTLDDDKSASFDAGGAAASSSLGVANGASSSVSQTLISNEPDLSLQIILHERQCRTRNSCLEAPAKHFSKTIFPILQSLKAREGAQANLSNKTDAASGSSGNRASGHHSRAPAQATAYNRYAQEALRQEETGDFQIDTRGTYHGITLKSITEGAKPKQTVAPAPASDNQLSVRNSMGGLRKRQSRMPIIIVPASATSLVTMYNASDLLQDLKFIGTEEKKNSGMQRDNKVIIQRRKDPSGSSIPYLIIDNPLRLTPDEWDRVVAVFVQGPAWQFKQWPWNGNPVEIFSRIAAFHLFWDGDKLDLNVAKWNVNVLALARNKRHLDRASLLKFWDILDKHMIKNKPYLKF